MNSRRLTCTPYRLISRERELRPDISRQMIADFQMSRLAYLGPAVAPCVATVLVGAEPKPA